MTDPLILSSSDSLFLGLDAVTKRKRRGLRE